MLVLYVLFSLSFLGGAIVFATLEHLGPANLKIVVFVGDSFTPLLLNWLNHVRNVCIECESKINVVCLDSAVGTSLEKFALACSYTLLDENLDHRQQRHPAYKFTTVWKRRIDFILGILNVRVSVILSDIDAIWLQNPLPEVLQHAASSDIISSKGWFPTDLGRKWGSTVCLGFIFFKATLFTRRLLSEMSTQMRKERFDPSRVNDQYALNQILNDWGVSWNMGILEYTIFISRNFIFVHCLRKALDHVAQRPWRT